MRIARTVVLAWVGALCLAPVAFAQDEVEGAKDHPLITRMPGYYIAEYKLYACTQYNDCHLALLISGAAGIPADHNIVFDLMGNPVTVNSGFFQVCVPQGCYTCPMGSGLLAGTGMDTNGVGGATGWLTTTAPVIPGEIIVLELMVFDVGDNMLDSVVLLDGFRWL